MKKMKTISFVTTIIKLIELIILTITYIGGIALLIGCFILAGTIDDDLGPVISGVGNFTEWIPGAIGFIGAVLIIGILILIAAPLVLSLITVIYGFKTQKFYGTHPEKFLHRIKVDSILKIVATSINILPYIIVGIQSKEFYQLIICMIPTLLYSLYLAPHIVNLVLVKRYKENVSMSTEGNL